MYDTIRAELTQEDLAFSPLDVVEGLENVVESQKNGLPYWTGNAGSIKVCVNKWSIRLEGSLCKFWYGNNLQTLTRQQTQGAINRLIEILQTDITKARVTRLDLGANLLVSGSCCEYLSMLGECGRYKRGWNYREQTQSYKLKARELIVYDKIRESKDKGLQIPIEFKGQNLLRVEYRIFGHIAKQIGWNSVVRLGDLYKGDFYSFVVDKWKDEYYKINKLKDQVMGTIKNDSEIITMLAGEGLKARGAGAIGELIDILKKRGYKTNYSRLKLKLNALLENGEDSGLAGELDRLVDEVVKYKR